MKNKKSIFLIIAAVFILWNVGWFIAVNVIYNKYTVPIPKFHGVYMKEEEGYIYNVKKPGYLRLTGNLGVAKADSFNGLIIWPLLFGGYEYGLRFQGVNGEVYEILVDKNLNPINNDDESALKAMEENEVQIQELVSRAQRMWNLEFNEAS
ncbi:hypothetical protein SAMN04487969_110161 [Paenibacillus algorifonticola]|uniref:Uncharacterized protein n=1 Tax=Paenibacillus algorifonticola TaxID=684063 RepID=A0A1I2EZV8_9BACL|nr:hypothetical protein [Paenibacillus algorifonticola]SFE98127.1 hypothetical protein SAMN04487969_110161 [Paenibacillus algorifonticola]